MSRLSNEKHRLIKSRHSQGLYDTSFKAEDLSREHSEYEVLAEFELRREK